MYAYIRYDKVTKKRTNSTGEQVNKEKNEFCRSASRVQDWKLSYHHITNLAYDRWEGTIISALLKKTRSCVNSNVGIVSKGYISIFGLGTQLR